MSRDSDPLVLDGARGEGGGQILRTALALSLCLQRPFRIHSIRAARRQPGLRPQHLVAVQAAAELSRAEVEGAQPGSRELLFRPTQRPTGGRYRFSIGTAGSTTLVLQTLLPVLLTAPEPSQISLEGGTHNPLAPTFEFLQRTFLPLIARMGPRVSARLERPGFYPAGGGLIRVGIEPMARLRPLDLPEPGAKYEIEASALLCRLPQHIAQRELAVVGGAFALDESRLHIRRLDSGRSPGNVLTVEVVRGGVTDLFSGIGRRGLPAEVVAREAVKQVRRYLEAGVSVGEHLADQLLLPLALAGGGSFLTLAPSRHTRTNLEVIGAFLPLTADLRALGRDRWRVSMG